MEWTYKGKVIKHPPDGYYGFVYVITDNTGKKYWGKKAFSHKVRKKTSKRVRLKTRKRVIITTKDSGWRDYWGSSKPLLEYIQHNGTQGFKREILKYCKNKQSLSYWETHYLFVERALFIDSWNGHVLRFFKGKIHS